MLYLKSVPPQICQKWFLKLYSEFRYSSTFSEGLVYASSEDPGPSPYLLDEVNIPNNVNKYMHMSLWYS